MLVKLKSIFETGVQSEAFNPICHAHSLALSLEKITNTFLFMRLENEDEHPYSENPEYILNILLKGLERTPAKIED